MKLLVSGAGGFTGRHFVAAARARGYDVAQLQANLGDREELMREIGEIQPQLVVHLAAIAFVGHANNNAFYDVNVVGTTNLLDALASLVQAPRRILLASSANVYGNCEHSPITEDQTPAPVNHYATSKLAMEYMARIYLPKLPLFFVRPFNYTGPGQDAAFVIPKLVAHFARKADVVELGNLNVEREFNDVRFVAEAYLQLLDKAESGAVYNVCTGNPVTLQAVIDALSRLSDHTMQIKVNPAFVRKNEIYRLCGSPEKLLATTGPLFIPSLEDTLRGMLQMQQS
ncbi:GDP-mannose 4,6-dehydratase [Herbaspirillum sp. RTI4]|uniref:NAD-dependent epimerase/dehydratase family protein n=1 Tax=Herbaspirillum sp. RTI4 TaxID=3048640 RepID=UPI002B3F5B77|nr:GDP-mannose 4,6-dehydratase [Herbaspirillum sp. RTI4]